MSKRRGRHGHGSSAARVAWLLAAAVLALAVDQAWKWLQQPSLRVAQSLAIHAVRVDTRNDSGFATIGTVDVLAGCVVRQFLVQGSRSEVVTRHGSVEVLRRFELSNESRVAVTDIRLAIYRMHGDSERVSASPQIDVMQEDYVSSDVHAGGVKVIRIPVLLPKSQAVVSYRVTQTSPRDGLTLGMLLPDPTVIMLSTRELAQRDILLFPVTFVAMNIAEQRSVRAALPIEPFTTTDQFSILDRSARVLTMLPDSQLGPRGSLSCRTADGKHKPASDAQFDPAHLRARVLP